MTTTLQAITIKLPVEDVRRIPRRNRSAFVREAVSEKLNREENITFIFSTHDSRVVAKARRVITLEDGKIVGDVLKNSPPKPPLPLGEGTGR